MVLTNGARCAAMMAAAVLFMVPQHHAAAQDGGIEVGAKAPAAAVETLDGKPADLASMMGKGPVVIQFWATWCPTCKAMEPKMAAAQQKYAGKVTFVGVAVSVNTSTSARNAFSRSFCRTPKRCSSSMITSPSRLNVTLSCNSL